MTKQKHTELTPDEIRAQIAALKAQLPKAKPGRKALISNERLIEIHSRATSNPHMGELLMDEVLEGTANGQTGRQYWGSPDKAAASMAVRVSKLRADGRISKRFAAGRRADPQTAAKNLTESVREIDPATLSDEQRAEILARLGVTAPDAE